MRGPSWTRPSNDRCAFAAPPLSSLTAPNHNLVLKRSATVPCTQEFAGRLLSPAEGLTLSDELEYDFRVEERRPLRRQTEDHDFWSLIMLAVTAGNFLLVTWAATKAVFFFLQGYPVTTQGHAC